MKCGCDFCSDMRNVEPARYIATNDKEISEFLKEADSQKKFIYHWHEGIEIVFAMIDECPVCGHKFTEEEYVSYPY